MACIYLYGVLSIKMPIAVHRVLGRPLWYNNMVGSGQWLQSSRWDATRDTGGVSGKERLLVTLTLHCLNKQSCV